MKKVAKKSLLRSVIGSRKVSYSSGNTGPNRRGSSGFNAEEIRYLNQMLRKFDGDLEAALDAVKAKYGHTGNY